MKGLKSITYLLTWDKKEKEPIQSKQREGNDKIQSGNKWYGK